MLRLTGTVHWGDYYMVTALPQCLKSPARVSQHAIIKVTAVSYGRGISQYLIYHGMPNPNSDHSVSYLVQKGHILT